MREIKFRAWNKSGNQWEYFTLAELALGAMYTKVKGTNALICHWKNYEHWGRSAGLKGKNGKDLNWWEGDIFDHPSGQCVIEWWNGGLYMHGAGGYTTVSHAAEWAVLPTKIGDITPEKKEAQDE
jgi:hypothetical protein